MQSLINNTSVDAENLLDKLIKYLKTPNFWISVVILIVAIILWQVLKQIRKHYYAKKDKTASTASHVAFDILRLLFIFTVFIALMQLNGINVTAMITGLGIVSIIVGLALQDFLKDIIMGAHILTDKFFEVGDVIRYTSPDGQTVEGEVISFNIRTTKIKLINYNEVMTISNRNISEIIVLGDYFDLDINIPYATDSNLVHETFQELADRIAKIDGVTKTQYKGTERFEESSVCYRIRYWTSPKSTRNDIRRAANRIIQDGMREAGIPFAFNHLDVEIINPENKE